MGGTPSALAQRQFLMWSHISAVGGATFAAIIGRDYFIGFYLAGSVLFSTMMHWCDNSAEDRLLGSTWCASLDATTLYFADRTLAAEAFQVIFLYGPDRENTQRKLIWFFTGILGNMVIVRYYHSDTWPVLGFGIALFFFTQLERLVTLIYYNKLNYFYKNHINIPAFLVAGIIGVLAFWLFWSDSGPQYWLKHGGWMFLVYLGAMFGLWGFVANIPLYFLCRSAQSRKKHANAVVWPANFWVKSIDD